MREDAARRLVRAVLWQFPALPATERCTLYRRADNGHGLEGTVLTLLHGEVAEIRYAVVCDAAWRTRSCRVRIESAGATRDIALDVENGEWRRDGAAIPGMDGVLDVDLGFSPCTNTLPIRRLGLEVGASALIDAAWLRLPDFDLVRAAQRYTRTSSGYRYESGDGAFAADLEVDGSGIVTRYGDYWRETTM